ncbi:hypothetical protein GLOIN_2v1507904 [Rhizophagus irregularis DAOM 181602=DAOM 197198]|uniref:Uncharacterized protein n=1 Tax=Rhizophagus irregularis (strain DAOM 181602 / DAOM 197198 / MUCL 43194) TaxID=747089 RepID=A0A2P4QUU3_RHIID|nr:hypothetical protein GLOIN_2v1507904 [Rhizophagus irregularis DAOM 181602=DAOM 197198]POG81430.1 hypothetical protein GLOIN_2v1507904 [Rhizophagus irregularis DAOM 181602=DAOM 197198]|eukprot:XP_025188296.1 hypothetical protein GLOIN_2v1507904 [Rhizophagus irregularis DAOM 181602=DAOM 197198]
MMIGLVHKICHVPIPPLLLLYLLNILLFSRLIFSSYLKLLVKILTGCFANATLLILTICH